MSPSGVGDQRPGRQPHAMDDMHAKGTLMTAAQMMRDEHGPNHARHNMWNVLAEWLDSSARALDPDVINLDRVSGPNPHALAVAWAYLEERPG